MRVQQVIDAGKLAEAIKRARYQITQLRKNPIKVVQYNGHSPADRHTHSHEPVTPDLCRALTAAAIEYQQERIRKARELLVRKGITLEEDDI